MKKMLLTFAVFSFLQSNAQKEEKIVINKRKGILCRGIIFESVFLISGSEQVAVHQGCKVYTHVRLFAYQILPVCLCEVVHFQKDQPSS